MGAEALLRFSSNTPGIGIEPGARQDKAVAATALTIPEIKKVIEGFAVAYSKGKEKQGLMR